ncbi:MAG: glucosaminidase domain-containing protein [Bacillota bacterium]
MGCVTIKMDGRPLDVGGHLIEGRVYTRARDLAEAMGAKVTWDGQSQVVRVITGPRPGIETDLRLPSNVRAEALDAYCRGTPMEGLGAEFLAAEEKWRVNAAALCSIACHESDFGRSAIARDKKNLFGIQAYDRDPYGCAASYNSFAESIDAAARLLAVAYLTPAGRFYGGPCLAGIGKRWATDPEWASKVYRHWVAIVEKI